jgi:hypothetical protein
LWYSADKTSSRILRDTTHPSELTLSVCLDIAAVKPIKLQGLR